MQQQQVKTGITPHSDRLYKTAFVLGIWFIFGKTLFYAIERFDLREEDEIWWFNNVYYAWDAIKDVLMILVLCRIGRALNRIFSPVLIFTIIRACILITMIFIKEINLNLPVLTAGMFLVSLVCSIYITAIEIYKQWKQNSSSG